MVNWSRCQHNANYMVNILFGLTYLWLKLHLPQGLCLDLFLGGHGCLLLPLDHVKVLLKSVSVVIKQQFPEAKSHMSMTQTQHRHLVWICFDNSLIFFSASTTLALASAFSCKHWINQNPWSHRLISNLFSLFHFLWDICVFFLQHEYLHLESLHGITSHL